MAGAIKSGGNSFYDEMVKVNPGLSYSTAQRMFDSKGVMYNNLTPQERQRATQYMAKYNAMYGFRSGTIATTYASGLNRIRAEERELRAQQNAIDPATLVSTYYQNGEYNYPSSIIRTTNPDVIANSAAALQQQQAEKNLLSQYESARLTSKKSGITLATQERQRQNFNPDTEENQKLFNFGLNRMTSYDYVHFFDVSKLPNVKDAPQKMVGQLIFTRPNLNFSKRNILRMEKLPMTAALVTNPLVKEIMASLSDGYYSINGVFTDTRGVHNKAFFMPLFSSKAINYSPQDSSLKVIDKGTTFYGHSVKYAHYNEDHKAGVSISIDFINDRQFSVLLGSYIWMTYIYQVSKGTTIIPRFRDQSNAILDYTGSIYYIVTLMDKRTIVYWEKLTGVFPKNVPWSIFSYSNSPFSPDTVTIEFDGGIRSDPNDLAVLLDINTLSLGDEEAGLKYFNEGLPINQTAEADANGHGFGTVTSKNGEKFIPVANSDTVGLITASDIYADVPMISSHVEQDKTTGVSERKFYIDWYRKII